METAVALLCRAGVDGRLLPAIADASPAKLGLRMPGTDIPVVSPAQLSAAPPDSALLFVSDLRSEVRAAHPEVEDARGGLAHGFLSRVAVTLASHLMGFERR